MVAFFVSRGWKRALKFCFDFDRKTRDLYCEGHVGAGASETIHPPIAVALAEGDLDLVAWLLTRGVAIKRHLWDSAEKLSVAEFARGQLNKGQMKIFSDLLRTRRRVSGSCVTILCGRRFDSGFVLKVLPYQLIQLMAREAWETWAQDVVRMHKEEAEINKERKEKKRLEKERLQKEKKKCGNGGTCEKVHFKK